MADTQPVAPSPVYLRALESSDLDRTWRWHNDPALYRCLAGTFRYVSRDAEQAWLAKRSAYSNDEVNLAICVEGVGEHIGNIYLRGIDWVARHGEVHLLIGELTQQSRGYGQAAVRLLVRHAFADLGLRRLYLYVLADNARAVHVYEKVGFSVEGKLRKHAFKDGEAVDVLVMGLCAEASGDFPHSQPEPGGIK